MSDNSETSFCELRKKEVVNTSDGKNFGKIVDLIFSQESGKVLGVIVPYGKTGLFSRRQSIFIPLTCVGKIGEDTILVDIVESADGNLVCKPQDNSGKKSESEAAECDKRCEKCMLFDCARRWSYT